MSLNKLKLKLNVDLLTFSKNAELEIDCDEENTPLDRFWRNRVNDSKIDNCVTVLNVASKEDAAPKEKKGKGGV